MAFVHLHTHSEYSLLDGANRIPELLDRVQALGMDSLAPTDHGNLHGAWQFYSEAKARHVRPILGFEAYVAFGSRHKRERTADAPAPYSHLVLLATNRTGYKNLIKLSSIGFLEGYYRRPRIDREVLEQHREGLIGLAACLSGEIALYLRQGNYDAARASAEYFARALGTGAFWLEVQNHGIPDEATVTAGMFRLAAELGLPVVATNDAHYLRKDDAEAHDVLLAIGTGKDLDDPNRFRFLGRESYVKSEAEMAALFPDHPEVLAETARVAELCEFDFEKRYFLPQFPRPAEFASDNDLLVHLARAGAAARYGDPLPGAVEERLSYELGVISHTGYAGYFLIVADFITAAKERGIPVGPGRGSATGSLVAYALGITNVDPLKFDLLFERFLNPERISMPDLEDPAVYELLRSGRTAGVFQFESPLATDCLRNMRCDRFDDLVAANALLRPGPLDTGMHLVFINRKLGREPVRYPHPAVREILEPTYGVITYQEQVMRIANVLAGFSLAEADVLRKAVGKKDQELIQQELGRFVERAVALGHDRRAIADIAAQIETFGRYGFNKSHAVAYSVLSYRTAWLKAHYTPEFMSALLSSEIGNTDKVVQYINEARALGLEVLPPDVNESGFKFTVVGETRIRFGLGAVRNVGRGAIDSILAARAAGPIAGLPDLVERIDLRLCHKRVLESLIAAGACDSLGGHRTQQIAALDGLLGEAQLRQQERDAGQVTLFGESPAARHRAAALPDVPEWTEAERLAREKEVIGFFISGHPLEPFRAEVELFGTRTTATLSEWSEQPVTVVAVVTAVKRQISKKSGKEYARVVLEDFHGTAEA